MDGFRQFMACPGRCSHLVEVDLSDSRPAFEAMVDHLTGLHGGAVWTREEAASATRGSEVISEAAAQTRYEKQCRALYDHPPHQVRDGDCYGNGPFRCVPSLPKHYLGSAP